MKNQVLLWFVVLLLSCFILPAHAAKWMIKLDRRVQPSQIQQLLQSRGMRAVQVEDLRFNGWYVVKTGTESFSGQEGNLLSQIPGARWVAPTKRIRRRGVAFQDGSRAFRPAVSQDPMFVQVPVGQGPDPMMAEQWHIAGTGLDKIRDRFVGDPRIVVAVIDTGVDYNHPDLNRNIWINPGESGARAFNGIDDDNNGYVDDAIGWDFVQNDNKPFDILGRRFGENEGHGTHCAGVIAGVANNGFGISGVAPGVRIMALRFMNEKGEGDDADGVKAIKYALDNGAHILNNSWGGEDDGSQTSLALKEIFEEVRRRGRLAVMASGNESLNVDRSPMAATPGSYGFDNMINVAAVGPDERLAEFSNFGASTVHIAAAGVGILSTIPGGRFLPLDGTSMAAPVVAGAAALYWSLQPNMNYQMVRMAILRSAKPVSNLRGKVFTGGRLDIEALLRVPVGAGLRR